MKCIILLNLVAVCFSYPYGWGSGRTINVNPDGTISITAVDGRRITISRGPNSAAIVSDSKWYNRYQPSQSDARVPLLQQYQGDANQYAYRQLLEEIAGGAQAGQVRSGVYGALQNLNQAQAQVVQRLLGGQSSQQEFQDLQREQQIRELLQQQQQYQGIVQPGYHYLRGVGGEGGRTYRNTLIGDYLNANRQYQSYVPYGQYGQQVGQPTSGQLSQVIQGERQILGQQNQIQQQQVQQQLQEQQVLQQLYQRQREQQQEQREQQYVEELQRQVQQEQEQVLEQQERVQQQQPQEQQQNYNALRNWLSARWSQNGGQRTGFWQQQPGVYSQGGLYGVYGQGLQRRSTPLVY